MSDAYLRVEDLVVEYPAPGGPVRAVDGVSFEVQRGATLAVVGESGCGKSTIARSLVRLLEPRSGRILVDGIDVATAKQRDLGPLRSRVQMVFQDPYGSLDPHLTAQEIVAEPLRVRRLVPRADRGRRAAELLEQVGLARSDIDRHPAEFSGGQRQRIGIARALASEPELLICDEVTSALDVSVQAQVLELLREIQERTALTYVFISHNLGVVREISEDIIVMRNGRVVESGPTAQVLAAPREPYTQTLRRAALDPSQMRGIKPRHLLRGLAAASSGAPATDRAEAAS